MISAKVLQHSMCAVTRKPIVTLECEYPRFIHSEIMTHRVFSRNGASSRAIPVNAVVDHVNEFPAIPVYWGLKNKGMQAVEGHPEPSKCEASWLKLRDLVSNHVKEEFFDKLGLHKQIANRPLEAFQTYKLVVTSTEWDNFFWLRDDEDAQPEIRELAVRIQEAIKDSSPLSIYADEYHVPYVDRVRDSKGVLKYLDPESKEELDYKDALALSASCCAQVSYRKLDTSLEKAIDLNKSFLESKKIHASVFEHQARPMEFPYVPEEADIEKLHDILTISGYTHLNKDGEFCSNNFIGWVQHRSLINNNYIKELPNDSD